MTPFEPAIRERFAVARQIADAVLFEGYVLYPYRASAAKNRMRWQFGVLVPPAWGPGSGEHHDQRTECLIEPRAGANLSIELRFLHAQRRTVEQVGADGEFATVDALELPDRVLVPWDEGVEERVELVLPVAASAGDGLVLPFDRAEHEETEAVELDGRVCGRLVRRRARVDGEIRVRTTELPGPYRTFRLTVEVANTSGWTPDAGADRDAALPYALVSAHVLLGLDAGSFLSMTDPPEWARGAVAACTNLRTWPVLAAERDDVVLSSPIILEDHPQVAPESPGALYDATEIDEILALRTSALTEREKREARGTDARAGAAVDLVDSLAPEVWDRLHGTVRALRESTGSAGPTTPTEPGTWDPGGSGADRPWWDPASDAGFDPATDRVSVDGRSIGAGSRVRLRPGSRRTDAQDLFLHGRDALVEAVLHDVDGVVHLAVTVDGDPGADIRRAQGRFLYFQPDELTLLEDA
ncbi:hypothetical protein [Embleya hyalina]|uniref:Uncharacterized protein n=1 Tax=Embleya hyalina TaxID=516124 RepID=A0A401Z1Q1_9ACTN|nr:hypothetical protein [Embleya hyalina]GCE00774.1 hypothetical protein EHYA_08500 [Embleya hyalina]